MKVSVFDMPARHDSSGRRRFSGGGNVSLKVERKNFWQKIHCNQTINNDSFFKKTETNQSN